MTGQQVGDERDFGLDSGDEVFDRWFDAAYDVAFAIVERADLAAEIAVTSLNPFPPDVPRPGALGPRVLVAARAEALRRPEAVTGENAPLWAPTGRPMTQQSPTEVEARRQRLRVRAVVRALGAAEGSLLDLHLRHGLAVRDLAEALGVPVTELHPVLRRARAHLRDVLDAVQLWHGGRPPCPALAERLGRVPEAGRPVAFDDGVALLVRRHLALCPRCRTELDGLPRGEQAYTQAAAEVAPASVRAQALRRRQRRSAAPAPPAALPAPAVAATVVTAKAVGGQPVARSAPSVARVAAVTGTAAAAPGPVVPVEVARVPGPRRGAALGIGVTGALVLVLAGTAFGIRLASADGDTALPVRIPQGSTAVAADRAEPVLSPAAPAVTSPALAPTPSAPVYVGAPVGPGSPAPFSGAPLSSGAATSGAPLSGAASSGASSAGGSGPVVRLRALAVAGGTCPAPERSWRLTWTIAGADTAVLNRPGGSSAVPASDGHRQVCLVPGATLTLTATGPGGTRQATTTA